ncbi:MAG: hypothetical protein HYY93_01210 [Planctomycetes bacterium]|nr:hypothetical protein [Planctomycetota bacterium]
MRTLLIPGAVALTFSIVLAGCAGGPTSGGPGGAGRGREGAAAGNPADGSTAKTSYGTAPNFWISHFVLGKGKSSMKSHGEYTALVTDRWASRPDGIWFRDAYTSYWNPTTKIGNDEDMASLIQALDVKGFWRMPDAPEPDLTALKRIDANTRALSVQLEGRRKRVLIESLSGRQLQDFVELENAFWFVFNREKNPATSVDIENLGSWGSSGVKTNEQNKADRAVSEALKRQNSTTPPPSGGSPYSRDPNWRDYMKAAPKKTPTPSTKSPRRP